MTDPVVFDRLCSPDGNITDASTVMMNAAMEEVNEWLANRLNVADEVAKRTDVIPDGTVFSEVHDMWGEHLDPALLACEADSTVGRRVIAYLVIAEAMLLLSGEEDVQQQILNAATRQVEAWYHG